MTYHPYVTENAGRVVLMRGPLLYCLERADHRSTDGREFDLRDVVLPTDTVLSPSFEPGLLGGVIVLLGFAGLMPPDARWADELYCTADERLECPGGRMVGMRVDAAAVPSLWRASGFGRIE